MYKYGDRHAHSYIVGVYTSTKKAIEIGLTEENQQRYNGRYKCEVLGFELDSEDGLIETVLRLERNNPLDLLDLSHYNK